jgi:hypothetical protein
MKRVRNNSEPAIAMLGRQSWRRKDRDQSRSSGYVVHTLEAALLCVECADNFADAVLLAVNLGDDANTVGAVPARSPEPCGVAVASRDIGSRSSPGERTSRAELRGSSSDEFPLRGASSAVNQALLPEVVTLG